MKKLSNRIRKELKALASQPDSNLDYSDIPAIRREEWACAVRGKFFKPQKTRKPPGG